VLLVCLFGRSVFFLLVLFFLLFCFFLSGAENYFLFVN
jgi:hypothetical protein